MRPGPALAAVFGIAAAAGAVLILARRTVAGGPWEEPNVSTGAQAGELQLSPRIRLLPGDPVRVEGVRGARFRYVGHWPESGTAEVVGPLGIREISRIVRVSALRHAGNLTREQAAMHAGLRDLSRRAHAGRRAGRRS